MLPFGQKNIVELTINSENWQRLTDNDIEVLVDSGLSATLTALDLNVSMASDKGPYFHVLYCKVLFSFISTANSVDQFVSENYICVISLQYFVCFCAAAAKSSASVCKVLVDVKCHLTLSLKQ